MPQTVTIRAGDTEPLEVCISATGLSNLDELVSAALYMRRLGDAANHLNGAALSVVDSSNMMLRLDPTGAAVGGGDAFTEPGTYVGYILATWGDLDETRHPGDDDLVVRVIPNLEA